MVGVQTKRLVVVEEEANKINYVKYMKIILKWSNINGKLTGAAILGAGGGGGLDGGAGALERPGTVVGTGGGGCLAGGGGADLGAFDAADEFPF